MNDWRLEESGISFFLRGLEIVIVQGFEVILMQLGVIIDDLKCEIRFIKAVLRRVAVITTRGSSCSNPLWVTNSFAGN